MKHLPQINIKIIPHKEQRYNTAGDYFLEKGVWQFRISEMENIFYEMFVLFHELWEWFRAVVINGVHEEDISVFDIDTVFEIDPKNGNNPGRSKFAPYHSEHLEATSLERFLIKKCKMDLDEYNQSFEKLKWK